MTPMRNVLAKFLPVEGSSTYASTQSQISGPLPRLPMRVPFERMNQATPARMDDGGRCRGMLQSQRAPNQGMRRRLLSRNVRSRLEICICMWSSGIDREGWDTTSSDARASDNFLLDKSNKGGIIDRMLFLYVDVESSS